MSKTFDFNDFVDRDNFDRLDSFDTFDLSIQNSSIEQDPFDWRRLMSMAQRQTPDFLEKSGVLPLR
jgi:hypothetical protein